jgi:hypothetical protein
VTGERSRIVSLGLVLAVVFGCDNVAETHGDGSFDAESDSYGGTDCIDALEGGTDARGDESFDAETDSLGAADDVDALGDDARGDRSPVDMAEVSPPECCPIDEEQRCGCLKTGGTPLPNGMCPVVCDAVPIVVRRFVDEHGCPAVQLSPLSCLTPPDASAGN